MKKDPQNKKENDENINETEKIGFFKKVWYSIDKIEKYSQLSAEGFKKAIKYLAILVIFLAIISSLATVYKTSKEVKNVAEYIQEKAPEFTYSEGILTIENSQDVIKNDDYKFGKTIIDTNTDEEEKINEYLKEISEEDNAIIILKNKLILKQAGASNAVSYNYKELFTQVGITEFNKQQLTDYLTSLNMMSLYTNLFASLFIYAFAIFFINTAFNIFVISIFGLLATLILKLKIRYVAVFNMAVYAVTLPTILNAIYIGVNAFTNYIITYFDIMYILIAAIYMMAAIFILKSEFNKKQGEVQKIVEIEKEIENEEEENKQEEKEKDSKEKNRETGKKDKDKKEKEKPEQGEEPEGSNA